MTRKRARSLSAVRADRNSILVLIPRRGSVLVIERDGSHHPFSCNRQSADLDPINARSDDLDHSNRRSHDLDHSNGRSHDLDHAAADLTISRSGSRCSRSDGLAIWITAADDLTIWITATAYDNSRQRAQRVFCCRELRRSCNAEGAAARRAVACNRWLQDKQRRAESARAVPAESGGSPAAV